MQIWFTRISALLAIAVGTLITVLGFADYLGIAFALLGIATAICSAKPEWLDQLDWLLWEGSIVAFAYVSAAIAILFLILFLLSRLLEIAV
jgi:hypothetical protein